MPHSALTKIGVVGFSRNTFDKKTASTKLRAIIETITAGQDLQTFEIVSGYTASGVPQIAYQIADELGITTVGFSAKQALRVKSGLHPVKKVMLFGERFGDESADFVAYIDLLIRIGGGPQSRHEVELFKKRNEGVGLSEILFEEEVDWYGS